MGSGTVPNPALGLGGSASGYLVHSPSSTALPPLPFDVDSIDFTWVATTKVCQPHSHGTDIWIDITYMYMYVHMCACIHVNVYVYT